MSIHSIYFYIARRLASLAVCRSPVSWLSTAPRTFASLLCAHLPRQIRLTHCPPRFLSSYHILEYISTHAILNFTLAFCRFCGKKRRRHRLLFSYSHIVFFTNLQYPQRFFPAYAQQQQSRHPCQYTTRTSTRYT